MPITAVPRTLDKRVEASARILAQRYRVDLATAARWLAGILQREAKRLEPPALDDACPAAWRECVEVPACQAGIEDVTGRLWDVLWMFRCAVRAAPSRDADRLDFSVLATDRHGRRRRVSLYALVGPGDDAEPVLTILLPGED